MRSFMASLTSAMLLVHALVGCCRHLDFGHVNSQPTACSTSLAGDCCHDEHAPGSHGDERPTGPCDCKLECKTLCTSLPPEKTQIDSQHSVPCIDMVLVELADAQVAPSDGARFDLAVVARSCEPPLRIHLLYQVILA